MQRYEELSKQPNKISIFFHQELLRALGLCSLVALLAKEERTDGDKDNEEGDDERPDVTLHLVLNQLAVSGLRWRVRSYEIMFPTFPKINIMEKSCPFMSIYVASQTKVHRHAEASQICPKTWEFCPRPWDFCPKPWDKSGKCSLTFFAYGLICVICAICARFYYIRKLNNWYKLCEREKQVQPCDYTRQRLTICNHSP